MKVLANTAVTPDGGSSGPPAGMYASCVERRTPHKTATVPSGTRGRLGVRRKTPKRRPVPLPRSGVNRERRSEEHCPTKAADMLRGRKHVLHFINGLRDLVGFRPKDSVEVLCTISVQRLLNYCGKHDLTMEAIFKFLYGSACSYITCEELPTSPFCEEWRRAMRKFFHKNLARFYLTVLNRHRKFFRGGSPFQVTRSLRLAQSLSQLKKGTPVVPDTLVQQSLLKHAKLLSRDTRSMPEDPFCREICERIDYVVHHVLPINSYDALARCSLAFPSQSACAERTRASGGGASVISELVQQSLPLPEIQPTETYVEALFPWTQEEIPWGDMDESEPYEFRVPGPTQLDLYEQFVTDAPGAESKINFLGEYYASMGLLKEATVSSLVVAMEEQLDKPVIAYPVALREPLKVRVITKGPSVLYNLLMPLQKFLWRHLKRDCHFTLIGEPISPTHLDQLGTLSDGEFFVSGDYESATDMLTSWVSRYAIDSICNHVGIPDALRRLMYLGTLDHNLTYDDFSVRQLSGQLMGSPLSFPLLCIINAAICSLPFKDLDLSRKAWKKLPFLVNGDDCTMRYNRRRKEIWTAAGNACGLIPSIGKCHVSRVYCQMNSETFRLTKSSRWAPIRFMNFSLLSDTVAKGGSKRLWTDYGPSCVEFLRFSGGLINSRRTSYFPKFMAICIRRLAPFLVRDVPQEVSWALPRSLGGVGLPIPISRRTDAGFKHLSISESALLYASYLIHQAEQGLTSKRIDVPRKGSSRFQDYVARTSEVFRTYRVDIVARGARADPLWIDFDSTNQIIQAISWLGLFKGLSFKEKKGPTDWVMPSLSGYMKRVLKKEKGFRRWRMAELIGDDTEVQILSDLDIIALTDPFENVYLDLELLAPC